MNKVFVCGDTHGWMDIDKLVRFSRLSQHLTKNDFMIVLGDWAGIWGNGYDTGLMSTYASFPWTTLIIDGNHDNHEIIHNVERTTITGVDEPVGLLGKDVFHLRRGVVYNINGKKCFVMGGGYSIDQQWRTPGVSWWSREIPTIEEFENGISALKKHDMTVDYMLTHSPPRRVIEYMDQDGRIPNISSKHAMRDGCSMGLDEYVDIVNFKEWRFGHMHVDLSYEIDGNMYFCHYNDEPVELV